MLSIRYGIHNNFVNIIRFFQMRGNSLLSRVSVDGGTTIWFPSKKCADVIGVNSSGSSFICVNVLKLTMLLTSNTSVISYFKFNLAFAIVILNTSFIESSGLFKKLSQHVALLKGSFWLVSHRIDFHYPLFKMQSFKKFKRFPKNITVTASFASPGG